MTLIILTTVATDGDCDGVVTIDDCDDNDSNSTTVPTDADCDGVLTEVDCDDNNELLMTSPMMLIVMAVYQSMIVMILIALFTHRRATHL